MLRFNKIHIFIIFSILFSSLVTAVTISNQNVYADIPLNNTADFQKNVKTRVNSLIYLEAMTKCMTVSDLSSGLGGAIGTGNKISVEDAKSGKWFGSKSVTVYVNSYLKEDSMLSRGILKDPEAYSFDCTDATFVEKALNLWGYTDLKEALCDAGATRQSGTCEGGAGWYGGVEVSGMNTHLDASKFEEKIYDRVYGSDDSTIYGDYSAKFNAKETNDKAKLYYKRTVIGNTCIEKSLTTEQAEKIDKDSPILYYLDRYKELKGDEITSTPKRITDIKTGKTYGLVTEAFRGWEDLHVTRTKEGRGSFESVTTVPMFNDNWVGEGYTWYCADIEKQINDIENKLWETNKSIIEISNVSSPEDTIDPAHDIVEPDDDPIVDAMEDDDAKNQSSCNIKTIGWLICPIVNFLADITDKAYTFIQSNFLIIDNSLLEKNTVKAAWSSVQGIANIAFIIAFLVIIFSQVTSFGITNYGIKKMLPRLVIAAILVNISFIICKLGVDLSNTIGSSISNFFSNTIPKANLAPSGMPSSTGKGFAGIAGIVLVGTGVGAAMLLSLSALIPVLLAGIVACVMILFILVGRKALIVMLAVLSPLAFVAYMLPNTKKLFDWWKKGFTSMLLVYPIVALVFAGSKLASAILMPDSSTTSDDTGTLNQIVASAVAIIPLFVVPGLLKKSLDGVAGIGNMVGKISTGASGLGKKAGAGGVNKYKGSDYGKFRATRKADIKSRVNTGNYEGSKRNFIRNAKSKAHRSINDSELFGKATGGRGADLSATAVKQDLADRKEFTESMGGNEELYSAVASGGFNEESDAFKNLTTENQTKIQKMKSRNLHRSASTYLATADYMTTNGLDDGDISHRAIQEAGKHNADQGTMIAAYKAAEDGNKKSGNFAALRKTLNHGTKYRASIDDNFKKGPDNKEHTYKDAISKIAPRDLSHHSFKGADSANAKQAYNALLQNDDNYAAASINQFSDMKAGTQEAVGEWVTDAGQRLADKRAEGAGYTDTRKVVPKFQNPQQAKTHLQNNIAPPPEIAPPSTPEVTTAPATSTEKFVPLRNRDGSILGEDMQSRDTKKSPGGIDL